MENWMCVCAWCERGCTVGRRLASGGSPIEVWSWYSCRRYFDTYHLSKNCYKASRFKPAHLLGSCGVHALGTTRVSKNFNLLN